MIYGNHEKKIGDVVTMARWDDEVMADMKRIYGAKDPGVIRFYIRKINYTTREILLVPMPCKANYQPYCTVPLDETNLLKVGTIK